MKKQGKCNTCKHCKKTGGYPQYKHAYGWCTCPTPVWAHDERGLSRQPLITKKEMAGKTCDAYEPKGEETCTLDTPLSLVVTARDVLSAVANE